MPSNPLHIALDVTYSVGDTLSGVGLYSQEILMGLAAAHPEVRFDFCSGRIAISVRGAPPCRPTSGGACWPSRLVRAAPIFSTG